MRHKACRELKICALWPPYELDSIIICFVLVVKAEQIPRNALSSYTILYKIV